jgi:2-succinyl-5-enolpyruvyl-6-hydroxy-3-cyclohexene-1-carboxylate synthase
MNALIAHLITQGVDYFCCAPGNRNSALLMTVAESPKTQSLVHFDERGLGFYALGYAKATRRPCALIVTSGTAVGNLLPAVMEADQEGIPLILLTADRPPELRDCKANQTCNQTHLFSSVVRWQVDLPCDAPSEEYLRRIAAQAVMKACTLKGPVQLNCMFREPLQSAHAATPLPSVELWQGSPLASDACVNLFAKRCLETREGVILAGSSQENGAELLQLAETLQWPILADVLSPLRSYEHPLLITHYDCILKAQPLTQAKACIQVGERFVSKTLQEWIQRQRLDFYVHLTEDAHWNDPGQRLTARLNVLATDFIQRLTAQIPPQVASESSCRWSEANAICKRTAAAFFAEEQLLSEPGLMRTLGSLLPAEWALFLGNSMPIRDANALFSSTKPLVFANRGASGIDGNIATAAGIAQGARRPTLAIIGDLALLHDLNSLALLSKLDTPLILCVINNGGGGIFSFLPFDCTQNRFETFLAASHALEFSQAAALFNIPYQHISTQRELSSFLHAQTGKPHSQLIEIRTCRTENVRIHKELQCTLAQALLSERLALNP